MRLSNFEIKKIKAVFQRYFLPKDELWLFGSRTDDKKRGGDIDLYIKTSFNKLNGMTAKTCFWKELQSSLGEQKNRCCC